MCLSYTLVSSNNSENLGGLHTVLTEHLVHSKSLINTRCYYHLHKHPPHHIILPYHSQPLTARDASAANSAQLVGGLPSLFGSLLPGFGISIQTPRNMDLHKALDYFLSAWSLKGHTVGSSSPGTDQPPSNRFQLLSLGTSCFPGTFPSPLPTGPSPAKGLY